MLRLIARFYDSQNGMLHFGGVDETTIDLEKLMSKISVVFQYIIEANIRYGKENAIYEEIVAAAKLVQCHDFIMKFPDGYKIMLFYENEVFSLPPLAKMDKA